MSMFETPKLPGTDKKSAINKQLKSRTQNVQSKQKPMKQAGPKRGKSPAKPGNKLAPKVAPKVSARPSSAIRTGVKNKLRAMGKKGM